MTNVLLDGAGDDDVGDRRARPRADRAARRSPPNVRGERARRARSCGCRRGSTSRSLPRLFAAASAISPAPTRSTVLRRRDRRRCVARGRRRRCEMLTVPGAELRLGADALRDGECAAARIARGGSGARRRRRRRRRRPSPGRGSAARRGPSSRGSRRRGRCGARPRRPCARRGRSRARRRSTRRCARASASRIARDARCVASSSVAAGLGEPDDLDAVARREEHHLVELGARREAREELGERSSRAGREALAHVDRRGLVREPDDDDRQLMADHRDVQRVEPPPRRRRACGVRTR